MIKNTASQVVSFQLISTTDGSNVTAGSPKVYVTGDGGAQVERTTGINHEGNGCWSFVVSAEDSNYNHVSYTIVLSGAVSQTINVYPATLADYKADVSGLATAAALATVDGIVDDILVDTGTTIPGTLSTLAGYLDTEIAAILEDTNELQTNQGNWATATHFATTAQADNIRADIAALNDLTTAQVQASAFAALDMPVTSGGAPTAAGMLDYTRKIKIMTVNKLIGDETTGEYVLHNDADVAISSGQTLTSLAGVTLREMGEF